MADGGVRGRGAMLVDEEAHEENAEEGLLQLPTALAGLKGRRRRTVKSRRRALTTSHGCSTATSPSQIRT